MTDLGLSLCMHNQFLWKGREIHNATTAWYSQYHGVVLLIPRCGTHNTTAWYSPYHAAMIFWYYRQGSEKLREPHNTYGFLPPLVDDVPQGNDRNRQYPY